MSSYSFLYIVQEDDRTDFAKVGISDQITLASRLRILNQGNPRDLSFKYLFHGPSYQIKWVEQCVKDWSKTRIGGGGRTEWHRDDPDTMRKMVLKFVKGYPEILEVKKKKYVPYSAKSYGQCPFGEKMTHRKLYEELRKEN
jgi:hypothetical protein